MPPPPAGRQIAHLLATRTALAAPLLLLACWTGTAHAQVEPPASPTLSDPAAQAPDGPPDGPGGPGGDHFMIGVGAMYAPVHHGADKYMIQPLPAIDIKWGPLFVNFQNGIGVAPIDTEFVTVGAGLVLADGYRSKDVPAGVGKLSTGMGARGFVSLRQFGFEATVGVTKIVTGSTEGMVADASLSYPIMVSERFMLMPSIGTTWGDKKHNNRYFGITQQQSLASGLPRFTTGSGFIDAKAEVGVMYRLTDRITLGASGGVTTLMGAVKDSPIVEHRTRPFGLVFVGYSF
ncbi:MipA/OmpV family protein [Sphingomonas sp. AOB5]|uniref:MipA/OmpV family protein n=1 Tax=Sphingomonas sp. AOB5 TaxID=3034017 RepID=UPI0023F8FEC8|nr:MipA/OmpV family protein [Sphingomonas sp. AOB5]MDF7774071.1 MipA/OmpV family protein [Sphingomonas sp. AOB5]